MLVSMAGGSGKHLAVGRAGFRDGRGDGSRGVVDVAAVDGGRYGVHAGVHRDVLEARGALLHAGCIDRRSARPVH